MNVVPCTTGALGRVCKTRPAQGEPRHIGAQQRFTTVRPGVAERGEGLVGRSAGEEKGVARGCVLGVATFKSALNDYPLTSAATVSTCGLSDTRAYIVFPSGQDPAPSQEMGWVLHDWTRRDLLCDRMRNIDKKPTP